MAKNKVFLVPPSFYALVAGAILAATIDFLRSLFADRLRLADLAFMETGGFAFTFLAISTGSFMYLSATLEHLRQRYPVGRLLVPIEGNEEGVRNHLWLALVLGFSSLGTALAIVAASYYRGIF